MAAINYPLASLSSTPVLTLDWKSALFIANHYNRSVQLIRRWCSDGTLIDFGFIVYQDYRKRWWIKLPDNFN